MPFNRELVLIRAGGKARCKILITGLFLISDVLFRAFFQVCVSARPRHSKAAVSARKTAVPSEIG
jgi:hypothetical protein